MSVGPYLQETVLAARAWVNSAVDSRWNNDPFGTKPHASKNEYRELFELGCVLN
jgi:hypothetical protein